MNDAEPRQRTGLTDLELVDALRRSVFVIGPSGVGKTRLLDELERWGIRLHRVDGALNAFARFSRPEPEAVDLVAVDHIAQLRSPVVVCNDASRWALRHLKPVFLVEQELGDLARCGLRPSAGDVQLRLHRPADAPDGAALIVRGGRSRRCTTRAIVAYMIRAVTPRRRASGADAVTHLDKLYKAPTSRDLPGHEATLLDECEDVRCGALAQERHWQRIKAGGLVNYRCVSCRHCGYRCGDDPSR